MRTEIISTGTELLLGEILNTNFTYLATELNKRGFDVLYQTTIGDNPERLKDALDVAAKRADLIVISGGLGPTKGDITKEMVAEYCHVPTYLDLETWNHINSIFTKRKMCMTTNNEKQAMIPEGAMILKNEVGTAPGLVLDHDKTSFVLLPGPPFELKYVCEHELFPYLEKKYAANGIIKSLTLNVWGLGESTVATQLDSLISKQSNPTLALYARNGIILVRITAKAPDNKKADRLLKAMQKKVEAIIGDHVFSYNDDSMAKVLGSKLAKHKQTIAFAESCTGGLASSLITDIPGSSDYLKGSVVTYSNEAKHNLIHVSKTNLTRYGAVSRQVACEMAQGVRELLGTDFGVSITGIAGPGGATRTKPVGLVYMAVADKDGVKCEKHIFSGLRTQIKLRSALAAIELAYEAVNKLFPAKKQSK
jgi:nicotinamide-nucleotide amidase